MAKIVEIVCETGGLVSLPDYENFRVYYGERVQVEKGEDAKEVKRQLIKRIEAFVEQKIEDTKREQRAARKRSKK